MHFPAGFIWALTSSLSKSNQKRLFRPRIQVFNTDQHPIGLDVGLNCQIYLVTWSVGGFNIGLWTLNVEISPAVSVPKNPI